MPARRKPAVPSDAGAVQSFSLTDPVTSYAERVLSGELVAGPFVRDACARHMRDMETAHERGYRLDLAKANRAISFFAEVLRLVGGEHEGKPFILADWQKFVVGSLFGWVNQDGYRRFRVAFVEAGKGSGKSPLAAGIGLYMLVADGEPRAEIYAAAAKKDQSQILFRDAVAMVRQSPSFSYRLSFSGGPGREWNIAFLQTGSFFRAIASDNSQSGPRPHCALIDEIHEHKDSTVVEMMRAGTKGRRQALIFMITNSGVDRTSVCYQYHEYAQKIGRGELHDDSFFAYVCSLDDGDDPFADEKCWIKSNPTLGQTIQLSYLREQVNEAKGMPSKESLVRRLNFSQWVDAFSPWISGDLWRACEHDFDVGELDGQPAYGGLDLSGARDLSSLVLVFPRDDGTFDALSWFWTPEETSRERARTDRVPYDVWLAEGHLEATPGRVVDYAYIARAIGDLTARYDIRTIAYDPYRIAYLQQDFADQGVMCDLTPHGQGYYRSSESGLWMPRSVDTLEKHVMAGTLRVKRNPVLTWNSASAVLSSDAKGNRLFDKRRSTGRIDGIVSLCMAMGAADSDEQGADLSEFFRDAAA
jgi:phage terminase large subunit-like protein